MTAKTKTATKRPAKRAATKSSKPAAKRATAKPRKAAAAKPTNDAPAIKVLKTYRVEKPLYDETMRLCKENGDELSRDILRKAMRSYVKRKGGNTEL